jgi:hypothetical protein
MRDYFLACHESQNRREAENFLYTLDTQKKETRRNKSTDVSVGIRSIIWKGNASFVEACFESEVTKRITFDVVYVYFT